MPNVREHQQELSDSAPVSEKTLDKHRLRDFLLPVLLFGTFGLFSWAIRGQSGYGAIPGCVFAGTLWGAGWFLLSQERTEDKSRRYSSGWSILALMAGIGISGMQGWMQWPSWVQGRFYPAPNSPDFIAINPLWGYGWFFIVALHWGGMGAIFLAWTGNKKPLKPWEWGVRLGLGAAGILIAYGLFVAFPQWFLPFYDSLGAYDPLLCPQCDRAYTANMEALLWLGAWFGFLAFEILRKDWHNVKLILTVSVVTGGFWVLFQFWNFMDEWYPGVAFNWWRCWESTGGLGIGVAYGVAFFLFNRKLPVDHPAQREQPYSSHRNLEVLVGAYGGLLGGLSWSIVQGIKGWLNLYHGIDEVLVGWALPVMATALGIWLLHGYQLVKDPLRRGDGRVGVHDFLPLFLVTFWIHRLLGLLVTGPLTNESELVFFVYYIVLAGIDMVLIIYWAIHCREPPLLLRWSLVKENLGKIMRE